MPKKIPLIKAIILALYTLLSSSAVWAVDDNGGDIPSFTAIVPESFPPYYQLNDDGDIDGFGVELMNAVSKRVGFSVNYEVKKSWKEVFAAMKAGEGDFIPNVGATKERESYLDFTHSVETFRISLFIRSESQSNLRSLNDLSGKKVGAVRSNIGFKVISKINSIEAVAYESFENAYYALISGQVDALAYPEAVAWKLVNDIKQERNVIVIGQPLKEIKRVIGVKKGQPKLVLALNNAIKELINSEEYPRIYRNWFSQAPSLWTIEKVLIVVAVMFIGFILLVILWRNHVLTKHKVSLDQQITDRTDELNDINELLQNVLDTIPSRVFWKDLNNNYLGCNKHFVSDAGEGTSADVIGKNDFYFPWKDRADMYRTDDSKVMTTGIAKLNYEEKQTTPAGETLWAEVSKIPLQKTDGSIYGVLGIYQDISARKKMEKTLEDTRETYAIAESIAHIGSWSWDVINNTVHWSDEVFRLFGLEPGSEDVDFELFESALHIEDRVDVLAAVEKAITDKDFHYDIEHRIVRPDGDEKVVHQQGRVFRNEKGDAISMIGTTHDITERKKIETAMRLAKEEAERANTSKSLFLSNMSHELRTPLHGILSYAQFGMKKIEKVDKEKLKKYFTQINSSGERLKILLDDLLDISMLEAGKMEMVFKQEDVLNIIESCVSEQQALIDNRFITVRIDAADNLPVVVCDGNRIGQVIMNLLSNAIKFTPDHSVVMIKINTDTIEAEEVLKVSMADQGPGVPSSDHKVIFDKFVQSTHPEKEISGTGLGLAITRELINYHYGKIWYQDAEGGGANFVFTLPLKIDEANT